MGKTSWQVKQKYNKAHYKRYACDLKIEKFEEIEKLRTELNLTKTQYLEMLFEFYKEHK